MKHVCSRAGILLALGLSFPACHLARGTEIEETQGFADFEVRKALGGDWSCFVNHQAKIRDDDPEYFLWHLKLGLRYQPVSWLQLAVDHRYQEERGAGEWFREHRTTLEGTPSIRLGKWRLSSRNRMEHRDFESPKVDRWRYRNQLMAEHPLPFWGLKGYASEEPHYDFELDRWCKHRITVGVSRKVCAWLSAKLYYRWDVIERSKEPGEWDTTEIVGVAFVADLDRLLEGR